MKYEYGDEDYTSLDNSLLFELYNDFEECYGYENENLDSLIIDFVIGDFLIERVAISQTELFTHLEKSSFYFWIDSVGLYLPEWMFFDPIFIEQEVKILFLEKINDMFGNISLEAFREEEREQLEIWRKFLQ